MRREFYQVTKKGSLKNLKLVTGPVPVLTTGKVLVEVKAIGLNYADLFAIMGLYSATPKGPFIPGLEYSGVVLKSDSTLFIEGDKVMGVTRFGGYDSHIMADPDYLMNLLEGWNFAEGAAFPVQTLTAHYALSSLGNLQQGQTVLIHSAAGGVGLQANRIAKRLGAYTIGVVGRESKLQVLKEEGYDAMVIRGPHFKTNLANALSGRELNLVLESSGGKYFKYSYEALAPMGRIVAYGSAQFTPDSHRPNYLVLLFKYLFRPRVDPLSMITSNKSVLGFNLIWLYERNAILKNLLLDIDKLSLPPPRVGYQFPFAQMDEAIMLFKSGNTVGKVVVTVP
jgi:NADPH:quinone reductase-like Zn-dependent oxidoreductase